MKTRMTVCRTVQVLSAAAAVATTAGVVTAATASADTAPIPTNYHAAQYVALGDSYSSGESVAPYAYNSDTAINSCHRSTSAYATFIARNWGLSSFDFAACSGAVTADLYNPNHSGNKVSVDVLEPAQLQHVGSNTRLVTLTIGGNDVGFSQILGACLYSDQQRATRTDCSTGPIAPLVKARIDALNGVANGATTPSGLKITPLSQVLRDIQRRAPYAQIDIGTYPYLISSGFDGTECKVGALNVVEAPGQQMPLYVSKTDATWMMSQINNLDSVIRVARQKSGTYPTLVAEARDTFRGHALCDTGTPYITPVSGTVSAATGAVNVDAASMHPTAAGQRAYHTAFWNAG